jgi:hypothetical protein
LLIQHNRRPESAYIPKFSGVVHCYKSFTKAWYGAHRLETKRSLGYPFQRNEIGKKKRQQYPLFKESGMDRQRTTKDMAHALHPRFPTLRTYRVLPNGHLMFCVEELRPTDDELAANIERASDYHPESTESAVG